MLGPWHWEVKIIIPALGNSLQRESYKIYQMVFKDKKLMKHLVFLGLVGSAGSTQLCPRSPDLRQEEFTHEPSQCHLAPSCCLSRITLPVQTSGMRWVAYLPPGTMVLFRPELRPRVMSIPMALLQPWSILISLAPVTTKDQEDRAELSWISSSLATEREQVGPEPHLSSMTVLTPLAGYGQTVPESG